MAVVAIAIFVVTYALIATERVHRVAATLGGVAALVLVGIVDARTAFFSAETGVDWNVIFLLLGMMIIVSVFEQSGVFEYLAIWAAQRSAGRPYRIAARHGQAISFWRFTKYGLLVTAMTLVLAWVYVWLRYYAFL